MPALSLRMLVKRMSISSRLRRNPQFVVGFVEIALQEQLLDVFSRVRPFTPLFHEVSDGVVSRERLVISCCVEVLLEVIEHGFLTGGDWRPRVLHIDSVGIARFDDWGGSNYFSTDQQRGRVTSDASGLTNDAASVRRSLVNMVSFSYRLVNLRGFADLLRKLFLEERTISFAA
jgi:hypothetical protein